MAVREFSLVKWFMDCVTETGDAAIVYCATLRWRGIHLSMGSLLTSHGLVSETHSSLGPYQVSADDSQILVEHPGLKASGRWLADAEPFKRTIYDGPAGMVEWNCLQPRSLVNLCIGNRVVTGLGYGECLTLTLPPWHLPMRQLRWGRFVSQHDSLAWIDWQGKYSTRFAIFNGQFREPMTVSDSEIVLVAETLRMEDSLSLRSGRLGATILPGVSALSKLLPHSLFNVNEQKWRSRGTLRGPERESDGWVIHEVVDWEL